MRLTKIFTGFLIVFLLQSSLFAQKQPMNINFNNLKIEDLIKITSKILNKNILLNQKIVGNVDFITNKPVYEDDMLDILVYVLADKGYTVVENGDILRIVRMGEASKYNLPVYSEKAKKSYTMITNVFELENLNVDYVASKIVHLIGKSARVVTDKKSNSLIITDFVDNIETIKKVIDNISKDNEKDLVMIPLQFTEAQTIATELNNVSKTLFDQTIEKEKVSIFTNKDTNSIILVGRNSNIQELKQYIQKVDIEGSLAKTVTEVIGLKNTEAKSIIKLLDSILSKKVYKNPELKPFVASDDETNTIVIMGPKSEVESIKTLIDKLDIDRPQVYVKAQIIEVKDDMTQEVGVRYGLAGYETKQNTGLLAFSSALTGSVPNLGQLASSLGLSSTTTEDGTTTQNSGLSLDSAGLALGVSVNLLKQNGAAEVLSEPSILAINNKESSIYVGERRSIKTGTTTTDGGNTNESYSREDIGLTLSVKPRISNDNKVILEINTLLEDILSAENADQPTTTKKEIKTSAIVNNGESVVLGGLIQNKTEKGVDKVPLLGDMPLLGQLFRNNKDVNSKRSLVVILTPYIVEKSTDLASVREYITELSQIENRVLKDLEVRKKQNKIRRKIEDNKRAEKIEELDEEINKLNKSQEKSKEKRSDSPHPKYVREMFGL
ncbi:MAG: type II secretion system secretin GspD [Campylobacterota bacterium]